MLFNLVVPISLFFTLLPTTTSAYVLHLPPAAYSMRYVLERAQAKHNLLRTILPGSSDTTVFKGHQSVNCTWALHLFATDSKVTKGQVTHDVLKEIVWELPALWPGRIGDEKEMCLLWVGLWERLEL